MKKILSILAAAMTLLVAACDGHKDFPDASMKVGDIVCTDGNVLPWDKYEQSDKKAIAVVFHVNQNEDVEGNGYAVYLYDIAPEAFCDSIGVEQGTSADITAYDGNMNTFALYDTKEVSSPLAERVFDLWRYGQSAYIPSVAQLRLLYQVREAVNPYITKCGGTPIPDDDDYCWYWSSTEVEGQETAKAWLYSLGSGAMQETPKWQSHQARPIITLNE